MSHVVKINERFTEVGIINHTLKVEGGYVDDDDDLGGATRFGITEGLALAYRHLWAEYDFHGMMSQLPYALAYRIIKEEFYGANMLDEVITILPTLASKILDWGVNAGSAAPIEALQLHLNASNNCGEHYDDLKPDGIIGSKTITALRAYVKRRGRLGERWLINYMFSKQTVNYQELTVLRELNERFYCGWCDRVRQEQQVFDDYWDAVAA